MLRKNYKKKTLLDFRFRDYSLYKKKMFSQFQSYAQMDLYWLCSSTWRRNIQNVTKTDRGFLSVSSNNVVQSCTTKRWAECKVLASRGSRIERSYI